MLNKQESTETLTNKGSSKDLSVGHRGVKGRWDDHLSFWCCLALNLLSTEKLQLLAKATLQLVMDFHIYCMCIYITIIIIGKVSKAHNTHTGAHTYPCKQKHAQMHTQHTHTHKLHFQTEWPSENTFVMYTRRNRCEQLQNRLLFFNLKPLSCIVINLCE